MKSKLNIKSILIIAIIGTISFVFLNKSFAANIAVINVETANIRKTADANSSILEQASKGQEVEILESVEDWYKIKYNNIQGYIRKDLVEVDGKDSTEKTQTEDLKTENIETTQVEETSKTSTENTEQENITTGMYTCKENTKLKIIPLIYGNDIKEINKDATINVLEINNKWALVESGTSRGWVLVSKIEKVQEDRNVTNEEAENKEDDDEEEVKEEAKEEEKTEEKSTEVPKNATMYVNSEVVNVRKEATISSESIARLEKATQVQVIAEVEGWSKIKINNQEGYILSTLLSDRKPETTTSRSLEEERQTETTTTQTQEEESQVSTSNKGQEVCNYANQFLGSSYVYGGTTPSGFDCSGFTQYVYKHFGVTLNRTAEAQASNGTAVSKSELKAGDLLIFTHHTGIYLGNGTFIHAANSQKGVTITSLSDSYYVSNYITARRIFN